MNDYIKVLDLIKEAGKNLKKHFGLAKALDYKTNYASSIVTNLDRETEVFLRENLQKIDPQIGFKGEEFGGEDLGEKFWLADPIDGSGLFSRGIEGCTLMLSLIDKGSIIFGAIYDFISDKMYKAEKGKGAFCNGERIYVSERGLDHAFLGVECDFSGGRNLGTYLKIFNRCIIMGNYPAGMHFALSAEGKLEGRICLEPYGKDYDYAAGIILMEEAGGVVKNIGSDSFDYTNLNFLAVNPKVYEDLTEGPDAIFPIMKKL